ncbi:MAG TPA: citrate synthase [Candidatus Hydrogenedentes bacterium]|nr:citrate synthase [Candidatus Hydrogenedentota bacterium]HQE81460.1 citrate synthase [Candidatus Hydrogenedentota bacterium]HQH54895.1 citrate synthase [Candidatus Hydrogenedentota bacterium]HQM47124.1 citrate synthase [Candidatus Hydrogenedentota bacterium]
MSSAKLVIDEKEFELRVVEGTEGEKALDITSLRSATGYITLDPGYANTGSCESAITFIDGEKGILRYRGYPIEELAGGARFPEVCHLLIYGHLPDRQELIEWRRQLTLNSYAHESMINVFDHYPPHSHPMAILSAMVSSMSAFYPEANTPETVDKAIMYLLAKAKTLAAYSYKKFRGEPIMYPLAELSYAANFLRMMFGHPAEPYEVSPVIERALDLLLILHADHEQNCSTSTVRMVGSSQANLFASVSAGISALWGPLHGGANQAVIEMLERIVNDGGDHQKYIKMAKDKNSSFRLMGFGHRVYKNLDPRARILKEACDDVLDELGATDPLLDVAKHLEEVALKDDFFIERKLYPNVDFYSGIIYRAIGIPTNMFTVMFALGRIPGWIAQWREMRLERTGRIHRPRQIYTGEKERKWIPVDER